MIDECIQDWTQDSRSEIKVIIDQAFSTNKDGDLSTGKIFGLFKLQIKDERWNKAMDAIRESINVSGTKSYLRIYERPARDQKYQQIPLDIASV